MSSSSPGTNASSGSGTKSLTEAGAPCAPAVPFRLPGVLGTVPHARHLGKRRRSMAVRLQSSCSRFAVFALAAIDSLSIRSIASCCHPLAALPLLVCAACPVSVSVRLACSAERDLRGTRDTTPGLCSASFCCSPRLHPLLASMVFPVGTRSIELSQNPRLGGARVAREVKRRLLGNRQGDKPHCAVVRCDAPGSSSLGCGTGKIGWKPAPLRACAQRHYPLAASDAAVAADELPQERGRGLAQGSRRMGRCSTMCCRRERELSRHAQHWAPRWADVYEYLRALRPPAFRR
jgi:hypothetical protein